VTALAVDALAAVRAAGGDVRLVGPYRLKLVAPTALPDDLIERVRAAKPSLLNLLRNRGDATLDPRRSAVAVVRPQAWAEALAQLDATNPPRNVPLDRWERFIADCGHFLSLGWANRAEAFGWTSIELFGCDRERPLARYEHMGLLWIIQGRRLVVLTAETATIDTLTGSLQSYPRLSIDLNRAALPWQLAS
jgi:hypothetical protein